MSLLSRVRTWLYATVRRSRMERDMHAELHLHIETYAEGLVRQGTW
jgi:hypothetical protein